MLKYVRPSGLVYENETVEQAAEVDRKIKEHKEMVDRELEKWKPGPAKFYEKWCRKHAPHLLGRV